MPMALLKKPGGADAELVSENNLFESDPFFYNFSLYILFSDKILCIDL